ncbi:MAG: sterol desaturase family protein [Vicinamibacteria bacterium]|nr:sterol desaturase family protein [Vicinamibacteria bacterium]
MSDLDPLLKRLFGDDEPERLGSGWWSGVAAVFFGLLGLFGSLCLVFPEWLTTPSVRQAVPLPVAHGLIQGSLALAFVSGLLSGLLRRRKVLALTGVTLALLGSLIGSVAPPPAPLGDQGVLGLDWFALNLLLTALVFVPMERAFPHRPGQGPFRRGWTTDVAHFFVSHLLVQMSLFMTLVPARVLFGWASTPALRALVSESPLILQFFAIVVVADLTEYAVHRLFHRVPWLWRFHAIHHSAQSMDWLAGSRLHLVDILLTRGLTFVPIFVLGFAGPAVYAYLVFVSFHAVFIHANVRFDFRGIETLIATPRFHHWHHSSAAEATDRNFAVHLPAIDRLFGTHYAPAGVWPEAYGIAGHPVPEGYVAQTVWPWRSRRSPS